MTLHTLLLPSKVSLKTVCMVVNTYSSVFLYIRGRRLSQV